MLTIYYIEIHKKHKACNMIKTIKYKCPQCGQTETYHNIPSTDVVKYTMCTNFDCVRIPREIIEYIK